jgi:hypothetical protein
MQLTFLGARYEVNLSPISVVESQISGKYRGRFFLKKTKSVKEILIPQSLYRLKYRGVEYLGAVYSQENSNCTKRGPMKLYKIGQPWQNEHFYCQ